MTPGEAGQAILSLPWSLDVTDALALRGAGPVTAAEAYDWCWIGKAADAAEVILHKRRERAAEE